MRYAVLLTFLTACGGGGVGTPDLGAVVTVEFVIMYSTRI